MATVKKIGYDARMIQHSGIGVRIHHILHYLLSKNNGRFRFFLFGSEQKLAEFQKYPDVEIVEYHRPIYSLREFFGHPMMRKMDLLDIPHFNAPWLHLNKTIVTVHDLTPYILKTYFPSPVKRFYLKVVFQILKKAKRVVGVSEHTLKDLVKEFQFPEKKLNLIYNGLEKKVFYRRPTEEVESFRKKHNLPSKFLLSVGIGKEHKNLKFVVQSLRLAWLTDKLKLPLVIAGCGGKIPDYLQKVAEGLENFLIPMKYIDYSELPLLYQASEVLVYPSLYEGFGFPLIEAQAQGIPVYSSNASVMPEILGESAIYFNPYDDPYFLNKLIQLLSDPKKMEDLVNKGYQNIERFSWEDAAEKTITLYETILASQK